MFWFDFLSISHFQSILCCKNDEDPLKNRLCRGGCRIFLRRGAPLRNDVTDGEVKKFKSEYVYTKKKASSQGGGGGGAPLHPPPRPAPALGHFTEMNIRKFLTGAHIESDVNTYCYIRAMYKLYYFNRQILK